MWPSSIGSLPLSLPAVSASTVSISSVACLLCTLPLALGIWPSLIACLHMARTPSCSPVMAYLRFTVLPRAANQVTLCAASLQQAYPWISRMLNTVCRRS